MIAQFLTNKDFLNKYLENYALRQAIANMQLENKDDDMVSTFQGNQEMINNIEAFKWLINGGEREITPYDLNEISYRVNGGIFNKGFRKTQVDVLKAKNFFPIKAYEVPTAIYNLFDNYKNIWVDLPIYEKEARLHIGIVRIQPYEDGNKRSARILTSYNLCSCNKAPVIMPGKDTDEYFGYIDNKDYDGMAKYLEKRSKIELEYLMGFYTNLCGDSIESNEDLNDGDVKIYKLRKKSI